MNLKITIFLIYILGPPGAGKSTTAQWLARKNDYVYYEADCFGFMVNPFVDPNVDEPTLAMTQQTPLKVFLHLFSNMVIGQIISLNYSDTLCLYSS